LIIAAFYVRHERQRLDDFLFPFLLGTLATYGLLPHFSGSSIDLIKPFRSVARLLRR